MAIKKRMVLTLCAMLLAASLPASALATVHSKTAAHKAVTGKKTQKKNSTTLARKGSLKKKTLVSSGKTTSRRRGKLTSAPLETTALSCSGRKKSKPSCLKGNTLASAHKVRVQKAQKVAMNKLMNQIGKPYRWGGSSPLTGFDCSGLIYYAYKDLVKIRIPRTANEMYHLRDAAPVQRAELQSGDLVFFRTRGRGAADHVGVYVGNGKFIQSPRTGRDIQITSLSEGYWQQRYVGARRVVTAQNLR